MLNKILTLALIIFVVAIFPTLPLTNSSIYDNGATLQREIDFYLDTILDKRIITVKGYEDFVNKIYTTNQTYNIMVKHEEKKVLPMKSNQISIIHITKMVWDNENPVNTDYKINTGDYITINIIPTSKSRVVNYLEKTLGIITNQEEIVANGMVR